MAKEILKLNVENFKDTLKLEDKLVVVDFYATWCGPCKMLAPVLQEINEELDDNYIFAKVDIDESFELAKNYSVMSVPTLIAFRNGVELKRMIGVRPKDEIKKELENI